MNINELFSKEENNPKDFLARTSLSQQFHPPILIDKFELSENEEDLYTKLHGIECFMNQSRVNGEDVINRLYTRKKDPTNNEVCDQVKRSFDYHVMYLLRMAISILKLAKKHFPKRYREAMEEINNL